MSFGAPGILFSTHQPLAGSAALKGPTSLTRFLAQYSSIAARKPVKEVQLQQCQEQEVDCKVRE